MVYEVLIKDKQNLTLLNLLVCDILDFSRLYSNEFKPNYSNFRIDTFLYNIKDLFQDQAKQKGIKIKVQVDKLMNHVLSNVNMDKQRLQQVLSNLVQNSIKYSYAGVITIKARFTTNHSSVNEEVDV